MENVRARFLEMAPCHLSTGGGGNGVMCVAINPQRHIASSELSFAVTGIAARSTE
jgi:hypothetical protein